MRNNFNIETILNSKAGRLNQHLKEVQPKRKKPVKSRNDCQQVIKMHWDLKYFCIEKEIQFEKEYRFHVKRKFRFDFALPEYKIGIEYDGLNSEKSGHTTLTGFTKDTEKRNLATSLGWQVFNYTVLNYQNVLQDIQKIIK
jgi:very-short-patch-repair endonuclease